MSFFSFKGTPSGRRIQLTVLLAFSFFLPVHLLWFAQVPVWYPVRCLLNGFPITLFLFIPALLCARISRPWIILMTALLLIPAILAGMHLYYYQATISQQSLFAILETNFSESLEFAASQISPGSILYLLVLIGLPLVILRALLRIEPQNSRASYVASGVLIAAALILGLTGKLDRLSKDNIACQIVRSCIAYKASVEDLKNYLAKASTLKAQGVECHRNAPVTLVVLIGESSSRHHWGIYGYHRDTTPKLNTLKDELLVFSDAISPFGRTTLSVASSLTCAEVPGVGDIPLTTIFKQAGFETIWISNQSTVDDSNMIVRLVSNADRKIYLNKGGDQAYARSYDEKILPVLDEILSDPNAPEKRIIFVHTMGSHVNYGSRFPAEFDRFDGDADIEKKPWFTSKSIKYINDYDNSILYTDHIISSVIKRMSSVPGAAVLFYSDHGEEVFDTRKHHGHHNSLASRYYVDIPVTLWLSSSLRASLSPETIALWKSRQDVPFINNAAPYIMLDICGVSFDTPRMADSPLSPEFHPVSRKLLGHNYDELYANGKGLKEPVPFVP